MLLLQSFVDSKSRKKLYHNEMKSSFAFLPLSKIFPTVPKSQSKPEGPAQNEPNKATISIFDDDEEEVSVSRSSAKNNQESLMSYTRSSLFFNDHLSLFCRICFPLCQNLNQFRSKQQCPNPRKLYQVHFLVMMRYGEN